ncbi:MAG: esterase [Pseudonocardiales bacterium]|nr:esterase [Pseudonocardiales bacterium]
MALDESTAALLARFARKPAPALHTMSPADARIVAAKMARIYGDGPGMAQVFDEELGAGDGAFTVRVFEPTNAPRGVLVYFHGGGWTIGSLAEYDALARVLADRTKATVVLVDYHLAPEYPYPAAVEDARIAVRWAFEHAGSSTSTGTDRLPVIVVGDSAGGNLAAVVAQWVAAGGAEGEPETADRIGLAAQALIYPVTDCDLETDSYRDPANQLMLERESMVVFWDYYLSDHEARFAASVSPLRAADLTGVAPAIVITAEHDVLRDEGEAYARRLEADGVTVVQRRFDGQMHGFFSMVGLLPGSADAIEYLAEQLEPYLAG